MNNQETLLRVFPDSGGNLLTRDQIRSALAGHTLACSGTISAIYDVDYGWKPALLKVFSRNWSRHTRDFCRWTYGGGPLSAECIKRMHQAFHVCHRRLLAYGFAVSPPLELWDVPDPFAREIGPDRALAVVVEKYSSSTVHQQLYATRSNSAAVMRLFEHNLGLVLKSLLTAGQLGEIEDYLVSFGFDPKPRNFVCDGAWTYVDSFPVLDPTVLEAYRFRAPLKALQKRFDTRYYLFDMLMRYYRVCPEMLDDFRAMLIRRVEEQLEQASAYIIFVNGAIDSYRSRWGHMLPDSG